MNITDEMLEAAMKAIHDMDCDDEVCTGKWELSIEGRYGRWARSAVEAVAPLIAAQALRSAVARIERLGSVLCDCNTDSGNEATNPDTKARMDHHCDCQAVMAAAEMLGSGRGTTHGSQCVCGGPTVEQPCDCRTCPHGHGIGAVCPSQFCGDGSGTFVVTPSRARSPRHPGPTTTKYSA
jgi:hypothetical protein